jgi:hypothetical protein
LKKKSSGRKRPKITRTSYISLPKELVHDIQNLPITKTQVSHCLKFVGILYRDSIEEFWDVTIPTPKPQTYLLKTFDDKYCHWLNVLIENAIVIRSDYYSHLKHLCYNYVVNPKYQSGLINSIQLNPSNVLCIEKYSEPLLTVGYKDIFKDINPELVKYRNWFITDVESLIINYDLLYKVVTSHLDRIEINDFLVDKEVLPTNIRVKLDDGRFVFRNSEFVLSSIKDGECLIKDKSYYKVVLPESFLVTKKATMLMYYTNSIERLKNGCYSVKRNDTNNRLDTNLTNMASVLVDEICRQNNLVQIDLSNSQFTLLSTELEKHLSTGDFKRFQALTASGNLYANIANSIGLKNDKNGKTLMFEIMFSSYRNNSIFKKKIKLLFPSVVGWIDQYKKKHGDAEFSVMLQRKESELFVDKIFERIKKAKMLCFSKHDSMIIRNDDLDGVVKIMQEEFAKNNLTYRMKVSQCTKEYFVYSKRTDNTNEQNTGEKAKLQVRFTDYFAYTSPTYTLSPAQFHDLTGRKYIESVSLTTIFGMTKNYNRNGFDIFWNDVKQLGGTTH